ncbi:DUF4422 domain-containing protein [Duncaniella freteri]|uniref:DUF4422 domain-containing protein n=1 Tax=Duncaniella freteri TaxID=2530391 RepID=UPI002573BE60|nr:DUF4422 domain-containing protein [Duncaniella freteri]
MEETKQPRIKILVACHKADPNIRQDDIYMPIQVGKALHPELDLGFQCDNTGDNISEKNGSYCELTALYWAWKNLKDVDYIGLCHYRRYFDLTDEKLIKEISRNDIIIGEPNILPITIYDELVKWTSFEDVAILFDSLIELYPGCKKQIIEFYYLDNKFPKCNMFIMTKKMFDDYCEFLFSILELCENRIVKSPYKRQQRVLGYLAETLIGLWVGFNKNKHKYLKINECDESKNKLVDTINWMRNNIAFKLSKRLVKPQHIPYYTAVKVGLVADGIELLNLEK